MLVLISKDLSGFPEEVEMVALLAAAHAAPLDPSYIGHPFQIHGMMRDGTQVSLALTLGECAQIALIFGADDSIRRFAAITLGRHAATSHPPANDQE